MEGAIHWFDVAVGSDVGVSQEDEACFLFGMDPPDWIKVPDLPGIPGVARRVLEATIAKCVRAGHDHPARHYILEGPVHVCVCHVDGRALWYTRRRATHGIRTECRENGENGEQKQT